MSFKIRFFLFSLMFLILSVSIFADSEYKWKNYVNTHQSAEDFTLIVLPDTQMYSQSYPETFSAQTQWIVDSINERNILFVTHEGDVVDDAGSTIQWERAKESMSILDDRIPYGIAYGNHDSFGGHNTYMFNTYFNIADYIDRVFWGGNRLYNMDNTYQFFQSGDFEFLILHLEYCPRDAALAWANDVVDSYPDKRVIITTHLYMDGDGTRLDDGEEFSCSPSSGHNGEDIWNLFIKNHENIFLVLSGHVPEVSYLASEGDYGNTVHQILVNYQYGHHGGDGYLRIMTFKPSEDKIYIETYSPTLDNYSISSANQFSVYYKMNSKPIVEDIFGYFKKHYLDPSGIITFKSDVSDPDNDEFDLTVEYQVKDNFLIGGEWETVCTVPYTISQTQWDWDCEWNLNDYPTPPFIVREHIAYVRARAFDGEIWGEWREEGPFVIKDDDFGIWDNSF